MHKQIDAIMKLEVPVIVRVGRREMRVKDIADMMPGRILELNKPADDELDLLVNNVPIGQGQAVKVGENFGISISFIGDVKARIAALGGEPVTAKAPAAPSEPEAGLAEQFLAG